MNSTSRTFRPTRDVGGSEFTAVTFIGAHGHVNPNLPVIAELVARGYRVSYAVPESFAQIVASAGATPVVYRSVLPDEEAGQRWPDGGVEALSIFLDEAAQALPQLRAAFDRDRPAVVPYDIAAYAARVLAHSWEIPLVQLSPAVVAWEGYEQDMAEMYGGAARAADIIESALLR